MSEQQQSVMTMIWRLKWWWMIPMGLIAAVFLVLVLTADASGDAPFMYSLF